MYYKDQRDFGMLGRVLGGTAVGMVFMAVAFVNVPSFLSSADAQAYDDCYIDIADGFATVSCTESQSRTAAARERDENETPVTQAAPFEVNENILILDENVHLVNLEVNRPLTEDETITWSFASGGVALPEHPNGNGFQVDLHHDDLPPAAKTMGARAFGGIKQVGGRYYQAFAVADDNLSSPDSDRPTTVEWRVTGGDNPRVGTTTVRWDDDDGRHVTCGDVDAIMDKTSNGGSLEVSISTWKLPSGYMLTVNYDHDGTRTTSVNSAEVYGYPVMSADFTHQGAC